MRTRILVVALTLLAACFVAPDEHSLGSAPADGGLGGGSGATGGGSGGGGTGTFARCVQLDLYGQLCTTVYPVVCGGVTCASGEVCCQTTGVCVAPGSGTCPKPPTNDRNHPIPCGSNADCMSDEYCVPDDILIPGVGSTQRCIGNSGHCQPLSNCAYCGAGPGNEDLCTVCGCDGRTYASPQVACVAGVHTIHPGRCGAPAGAHDGGAYTVTCGTNEQCPANAQCCFRTGKCFDVSEPWRCELQPNGAILDCASHEECTSGAGGGSGNQPPTGYCAADGCGGPGLCSARGSTNSCGGEVQPACGCDGVTYVNACWAHAGGTRVAASGACP